MWFGNTRTANLNEKIKVKHFHTRFYSLTFHCVGKKTLFLNYILLFSMNKKLQLLFFKQESLVLIFTHFKNYCDKNNEKLLNNAIHSII